MMNSLRHATVAAAVAACSLTAAVTPGSAQSFTIQDVSAPADSVGMALHAVDADGNAMFLWQVGPAFSPGSTFRTARYDASTDTISPSADLVMSPPGYVSNLVVDRAGNATAAGFRFLGSGKRELVAARYSGATGAWGAFAPLMSPLPPGAHSFPDVFRAVVDARGDVTIVWIQATCDACATYALYAARSAPSGGWSVRVVAADVWYSLWPAVTVDASGNVLVVAARDTTRIAVMAARYSPASDSWSVSDGPDVDTFIDFQRLSAVAVAGDGRALLAWQDSFGLFGVLFDTVTGTWGSQRPLSSTIAANAPAVAADQSGNFMVMWGTGFTATSLPRLLSRRFSSSTGVLEDAVTLSTFGAGGHVVIGADGIPTAVWLEGQTTLKASRYSVAAGSWSGGIDVTSVDRYGYLQLVGLSQDAAGSVRASWIRRPGELGNHVLQTTRWQFGTGSPGAPVNLRASVSGRTVTLTWSPPSSGALPTGYTLVARMTVGGSVLATLPMGAATSFSVNAPDGTFVLSVTATNEHGAGPESAPVTVTVPETGPAPASNAAGTSPPSADVTLVVP
jgi:hypothetical protein